MALPSPQSDSVRLRPQSDARVPVQRADAPVETSTRASGATTARADVERPTPKNSLAAINGVHRPDAQSDRTATPDDARALPDVDMPLLDDATWYTAHDLDRYPQPLMAVQPRYPVDAGGAAGEVDVLLAIDASGRIVEREVVDAQPPGVFDAAALAAFDALTFVPGMREGRAVRTRLLVRLRFSAPLAAVSDPATAR